MARACFVLLGDASEGVSTSTVRAGAGKENMHGRRFRKFCEENHQAALNTFTG